MDQLLDRYNLSQRTSDNLNRAVSIKETESLMNNLLKQKASCPNGFTGDFYQTVKEKNFLTNSLQSLSEDRNRRNTS